MSIVLGKNKATGEIVSLKKKTLQRHICTLGTSGSGKIVFCKVVIEEAVRLGIPVIIIDPQGDIASLGLSGDPAILQEKGYSPEFAEEYLKNAEVRIWTPASSKGIPLSINPLKFSAGFFLAESLVILFLPASVLETSVCAQPRTTHRIIINIAMSFSI